MVTGYNPVLLPRPTKPVHPPSKPPSSLSSLLDLSPHIRLSPLQVILPTLPPLLHTLPLFLPQRASSHISLTLHDKREETLLDQARRISVGEALPSVPPRTSPGASSQSRPSPSHLSRHQSQVAGDF